MLLDWDSSLLLAVDKFGAMPLDYVRADVAPLWVKLLDENSERWWPMGGAPLKTSDEWCNSLWADATATPTRQAAILSVPDADVKRKATAASRINGVSWVHSSPVFLPYAQPPPQLLPGFMTE